MLKLNINEKKQLTFEVQIGGVQPGQISGFVRLEIDNIEYGFPVTINNESIIANIPPLKKITNKQLDEGTEYSIRLDIVADGNYLQPWKDSFTIDNPLVIEAKIVDNTKEKFINVSPPKTNVSEKKQVNEVVTNKKKELKKVVKEEIQPKKKEVNKQDNDKKLKDFISNLTEDQIFKYMEKNGSKNPQIQNIIFEQATMSAKSNKPAEILKQVIKLMGKYKVEK